jgi:peptidoglycan-associated lipoprotein
MMANRFLLVVGVGALALAAACSNPPAPAATTPAVDSAALRARADSVAGAARRDTMAAVARRDSLERVRADSLARVAQQHRADSVRAQVLRDSVAAAEALASGLARAQDSTLALPVYFALDRADLDAPAVRALEQKLAILRANPRLELVIEGHCDERGPDEYNLALGNRRAAAVKQWFTAQGIGEGRLAMVSYGEERPADPRSNEDAWARNRRAEFRIARSAR